MDFKYQQHKMSSLTLKIKGTYSVVFFADGPSRSTRVKLDPHPTQNLGTIVSLV